MMNRHQNLIVLVAVLLAELMALAYQVHRNKEFSLLRQVPMLALAPVERAIHAVSDGTWGLWREYADLRGARRENRQLARELNDMKLENQRFQEEAAQAKRFEVLLQFKEKTPFETVAASIISSGGNDSTRLVVLDRGRQSGLRPDMAVIVPDGIVGKVLRVFPYAAQVLLLTDSNSGVACLLENSRVQGILKGQSKELAILTYIPNDEKVEIGERVLTSGEDQIYPKGLPVGVVVEAHPGPSFQEIVVQPFAKLNRLEEVLVVTSKADVEVPTSSTPGQTVAGFSDAALRNEPKTQPKAEPKGGPNSEPDSAAVRKPGLFRPADSLYDNPNRPPASPALRQPPPSGDPRPGAVPGSH
jgi:rod shape-determining protein MreC